MVHVNVVNFTHVNTAMPFPFYYLNILRKTRILPFAETQVLRLWLHNSGTEGMIGFPHDIYLGHFRM
jgi:hypothetical protein